MKDCVISKQNDFRVLYCFRKIIYIQQGKKLGQLLTLTGFQFPLFSYSTEHLKETQTVFYQRDAILGVIEQGPLSQTFDILQEHLNDQLY